MKYLILIYVANTTFDKLAPFLNLLRVCCKKTSTRRICSSTISRCFLTFPPFSFTFKTSDLVAVHQGVRFSQPYSLRDLIERWHALLYDGTAARYVAILQDTAERERPRTMTEC